eukprot:3572746-Alexandrium_andersonii.AAC.1
MSRERQASARKRLPLPQPRSEDNTGRPSPAVRDLAVQEVALEHLAGLGVHALGHEGVVKADEA